MRGFCGRTAAGRKSAPIHRIEFASTHIELARAESL
jgi:hypothetical protein